VVEPRNAGVNKFAQGHAECRIAEKELEEMLSFGISLSKRIVVSIPR
jgi:hypothetical protein